MIPGFRRLAVTMEQNLTVQGIMAGPLLYLSSGAGKWDKVAGAVGCSGGGGGRTDYKRQCTLPTERQLLRCQTTPF